MVSVKSTPPTLRKVGAREMSGALPDPGQVGYPPSMNTDASMGDSCMGYQSHEVAFASRDAGRPLSGPNVKTCMGRP